jgi:hypothetical protein
MEKDKLLRGTEETSEEINKSIEKVSLILKKELGLDFKMKSYLKLFGP